MSQGQLQHAPGSRWRALDALVLEEMEALGGSLGKARAARRPPDRSEAPFAAEADFAAADEIAAEDPRDEESFIERTVDYLRDRPDADALLEAVRAALNDEDPVPPAAMEADQAPAGEAGPSDPQPPEAAGSP